tara:strand:+ start:1871 stop:2392 length:522 start_codon:yes stop_codon:yes gene_type:complete
MKNYIFLLSIAFIFFSCQKEEGCTDEIATNFNSSAEEDNGTCNYSVSGGYWITQSSSQSGSVTTSVDGTVISDSTFNSIETNPDSLEPYKLEFLDNKTYTEYDILNNVVEAGTWSVNGNQLSLNPGDTLVNLTLESIDRNNVVINTSFNESLTFMGNTVTYDISLSINSARQF